MSRYTRWILLAALCAAGGCTSYRSRPIDLAAYDARWAGVLGDHESLDRFAQQIGGPDAQAPASADGLTLAEARVVALVGNPALRRARLEAGVAVASAEFAGRWADPVLELGLMRNVDTGSDPWIVGGALGFTVPISGSLGAERDLADREANHAQLQAAVAEWELLGQLDQHWIAWSATRQKASALAGYLDELDALVQTADRLAQAGEAAPTEARLLRIERVRRGIELSGLESAAAQQELTLLALMGLRPDVNVVLRPGLPDDRAVDPSHLAAAVGRIETYYPPLLAELAAYDAAELALKREIRKQYPDLTIGPAYEEDEGQSRIGVGMSIPLPLINRNQRGIAEADTRRELARAEVERVYQQAVTALVSTSHRLESANARRDATVNALAPLVEEQVRELRELIELGEVDVLLLKDALLAVADARLAVIEARAEAAAASAALHRLVEPTQFEEPSEQIEMETE